MRALLICALALGPLAACGLYSDDTGCDPIQRSDQLVNPATLACEVHTATEACGAPPADLSWGECASACRALPEAACLTTPGCRGAYDHDCFFGVGACARPTPFLGCYPTDLNLDNATGCAGLDAWSCSRHEACVGTYRPAAACSDGLDQNGDGVADDPAECTFAYARCVPEPVLGG
ncbi:MAG: hypothetical protein IPL61_37895 [Myxococcales bacterium]|nr:hypothetical protein [Myxococcales bacterium]